MLEVALFKTKEQTRDRLGPAVAGYDEREPSADDYVRDWKLVLGNTEDTFIMMSPVLRASAPDRPAVPAAPRSDQLFN
jgi:hypothetical protein